jgi:hypothetical protein
MMLLNRLPRFGKAKRLSRPFWRANYEGTPKSPQGFFSPQRELILVNSHAPQRLEEIIQQKSLTAAD